MPLCAEMISVHVALGDEPLPPTGASGDQLQLPAAASHPLFVPLARKRDARCSCMAPRPPTHTVSPAAGRRRATPHATPRSRAHEHAHRVPRPRSGDDGHRPVVGLLCMAPYIVSNNEFHFAVAETSDAGSLAAAPPPLPPR